MIDNQAAELPPTRRNRGMLQIATTLQAGVPQRFGVSGDYFHVLTAPVNDLRIRFDDSKQMDGFEGVGARVYYESVEVESATGQAIKILVGFGSVFDGRATSNVNVSATVAPGNTSDNGGDVSCLASAATQLLAADADRLYALIHNPSTNTLTMRIGSSAVAAATGIPLEPGTTLPYPSTGAVYAYNPHASTAETLSAAAVKRV